MAQIIWITGDDFFQCTASLKCSRTVWYSVRSVLHFIPATLYVYTHVCIYSRYTLLPREFVWYKKIQTIYIWKTLTSTFIQYSRLSEYYTPPRDKRHTHKKSFSRSIIIKPLRFELKTHNTYLYILNLPYTSPIRIFYIIYLWIKLYNNGIYTKGDRKVLTCAHRLPPMPTYGTCTKEHIHAAMQLWLKVCLQTRPHLISHIHSVITKFSMKNSIYDVRIKIMRVGCNIFIYMYLLNRVYRSKNRKLSDY